MTHRVVLHHRRCAACGLYVLAERAGCAACGSSHLIGMSLDQIVEDLAHGELELQQAVATVLEPGTTPMGAVLDEFIRRINGLGLLPSYMGSDLDVDARVLHLYFSSAADEQVLRQLETYGAESGFEAQLLPTDGSQGTQWALVASQTRPTNETPPTAGTLDVEVPMAGNLYEPGPL